MSAVRGRKSTTWRVLITIMAFGLLATACPEDDNDVADPDDDDVDDIDVDDDDDDVEDDEEVEEADRAIELGWIPWEEAIAVTFMWKEILEQEGYEVEDTQLDVAPVFAGVAGGELDCYLDMWMPDTHASYDEEFGDQFETLAVWYDEATLELTVPAYVVEEHGIESLEDLAGNADLFDGEITGIEAGAGMMELLRDEVMPTYGLDDEYELLESSTAAMRADLESAYDAEEPIVVTLWTPHPEYGMKDLTRLDDPENAWGDAEELHAICHPDFVDDFPQVTGWIENWEMTDEELSDLNATVEEAEEDEWQDAAAEWVEENRDVVDGWIG